MAEQRIKIIKNIVVVCFANYCRSPVAEKILQKKFLSLINVSSAGIHPMVTSSMDKRSLDFLAKKGFEDLIHTPRKISIEHFIKNDYIFCLDQMVLMQLNKTYKKYSHKIMMLNYQKPHISIPDPFKHSDKDYAEIMERIQTVCCSLEL